MDYKILHRKLKTGGQHLEPGVNQKRTSSGSNSELQVLGNNSKTVNNIKNLTWDKNDQHIKIYLPCNFEVNLITYLGVIALFSSNL
jgi:hypothetical protein